MVVESSSSKLIGTISQCMERTSLGTHNYMPIWDSLRQTKENQSTVKLILSSPKPPKSDSDTRSKHITGKLLKVSREAHKVIYLLRRAAGC